MADGSPFRIKFTPIVCTSDAVQDSHIAHCKAVPLVKRGRNGALAVVGSGPSVSAHIDELCAFDGEVWGINGAASWLAKQGVDAALVTVDAKQFDPWMYEGVKSAVVASCAHPSLFDHFTGNVEKFHMAEHAPGGVFGGVTTATRMAALGIMLGFTSITFYGCEGSFSGSDHVNQNEQLPDQLIVKAGGELHRTYPEFLLQAENLAAYIDQYPEIFKERSGGLLRGLVGNADTWSIVAVSGALKEKLESQCGSHGLYDDKFDLQQTSLAVAG